MPDLQHHSGLVRLCLAACGRATLTGVHQPRPELLWRLSSALPLGCYGLLALAIVLAPVQGVKQLMGYTAVFSFLLQAAAVLVTLLAHRGRLRRLNAQLEWLEGEGGYDAPYVNQTTKVQVLASWMLNAMMLVEWMAYEFKEKPSCEPPSMIPMWKPESLRQPPGSWVLLAFQVLITAWACCLLATFDSCYVLWMKAAGSHLKAIRRMLSTQRGDGTRTDEDLRSDRQSDTDMVPTGETSPGSAASGWRLRRVSAQITKDGMKPQESSTNAANMTQSTDISGISEATLREADRYYDGIVQLVSAINDLTSALSLITHAATLINFLVNAFLLLWNLLSATSVNTPLYVASACIELGLLVFRLTIYSLGGDEIIRESSALRQALVNLPWRRLTAEARQQREELLLKLQHPPCVEPLGFFTVRKSNLLSMMGLFLTYFVIIVQMVRMPGND